MQCLWCHNPESQDKHTEEYIKTTKIGNREFCEKEIIGKSYSVNKILDIILEDHEFYKESQGGVTFTGGEPLLQSDFILDILIECNRMNIHTAIDTGGNVDSDAFSKVLTYTDLFLFDIKLMDDRAHKKYTGTSNKRILSNFINISGEDVDIIARIPVIPGITDTGKNIDQLIAFLKNKVKRVDLLPYHSFAKSKYNRLTKKYSLEEIKEPSSTRLKELKDYISASGFDVQIGG